MGDFRPFSSGTIVALPSLVGKRIESYETHQIVSRAIGGSDPRIFAVGWLLHTTCVERRRA